jgi:PAS domain S-box-containing protein
MQIEAPADAVDALAQLQRQHELILHAAGDGIYGVDREGKITFINPAAAKMLGWDSKELIDKRSHALLHHTKTDGSDYPQEECPIYAAFKDGRVHRVEDEVFWRNDGSSFPVEYSSTPIHEHGELVGAVVVFSDITERKRAEEELRNNEERFRRLFDYSGDGLFLIDLGGGKILDANRKACEMLGFSSRELRCMHISDVHPNEMPKFLAFAESVISQGHGQTDELTCLTKRGHSVPAEISASIYVDSDDGNQLMLASVRNISKRKQAEAALRKAHAEVHRLKEQLQAENIYLQEEIKTAYNFEEIIGHSSALRKVLRQIEQVALTESTVLIHGETGTGKELVARAIHNLSPRAERPLVKVNCGAIAQGLVESELFGHEKGAFTGALQKRIGRFELADGGTIFLDEVGELPPDTQVKLLHALQEQEFERVGGSQPLRVDVRIIAATNRDLAEMVRIGKFRMDLFYRLNVFPVQVPPLRERTSDIPLLVNHLLGKLTKRLGKPLQGISPDTLEHLMCYPWPGNIRELENIIERAAIVAPSPVIDIDETLAPEATSPPEVVGIGTLEQVERAHILATLEKTGWTISGKRGAAAVLGLNPSTLRSRLQKLGIERGGPAG